MPLLRREIEMQPDEIFTLSSQDFPWGVAHVRSRQEKVLARHLVRNGIPFYLPLIESRRRRDGRLFTSHLPLFAGYVFHRTPPAQRDVLWHSKVIANHIDVSNQTELGAELAQLRALQLAGVTMRPYQQLAPGQAVRIQEGAFAGYTGVVLRGKGHDRLIVSITLLRQSVAVEFDRPALRRLR